MSCYVGISHSQYMAPITKSRDEWQPIIQDLYIWQSWNLKFSYSHIIVFTQGWQTLEHYQWIGPWADSVIEFNCPSVCLYVCAIAKHPLLEVEKTSGRRAYQKYPYTGILSSSWINMDYLWDISNKPVIWCGCTLRSGLHEIPTEIRIFPHGLENNHECKWISDNFPRMRTYVLFLENFLKFICSLSCSPIHVERSFFFLKVWTDLSPRFDTLKDLSARIGEKPCMQMVFWQFSRNNTYVIIPGKLSEVH